MRINFKSQEFVGRHSARRMRFHEVRDSDGLESLKKFERKKRMDGKGTDIFRRQVERIFLPDVRRDYLEFHARREPRQVFTLGRLSFLLGRTHAERILSACERWRAEALQLVGKWVDEDGFNPSLKEIYAEMLREAGPQSTLFPDLVLFLHALELRLVPELPRSDTESADIIGRDLTADDLVGSELALPRLFLAAVIHSAFLMRAIENTFAYDQGSFDAGIRVYPIHFEIMTMPPELPLVVMPEA